MKLDINQVYHQYITKVVIFALFLFKRQLRQPSVYKQSVLAYVTKRIPWKINLRIDTGSRLDKDDEREILLDELLNDVKSGYLSFVLVTFTTPLKQTTIEVNLKDEERYEKFLYS
jgi:asparagine synthetase B (glutamine-hydrolysing)